MVIDLTYSLSRMANCRLARQQVCLGEYQTVTSRPRDRELLPVSRINSSLTTLIRDYEHQTEIERNQILDFHVRFEEIFPFEDGNGRVGRLIMFKECLRHGTMPFIIDDKCRSRYLRGIKEWYDDHFEMIDVVMEAQDRFEAQIELQRLHAAGLFFAPVSYQEGFVDESIQIQKMTDISEMRPLEASWSSRKTAVFSRTSAAETASHSCNGMNTAGKSSIKCASVWISRMRICICSA